MQLASLHEFVPLHQEILVRYMRACDEENDLKKLAILAQDFDEASDSFGYDALQALSDRYMENSVKKQVIEDLLAERKTHENEIVTF
jgi:hypothetical protein